MIIMLGKREVVALVFFSFGSVGVGEGGEIGISGLFTFLLNSSRKHANIILIPLNPIFIP